MRRPVQEEVERGKQATRDFVGTNFSAASQSSWCLIKKKKKKKKKKEEHPSFHSQGGEPVPPRSGGALRLAFQRSAGCDVGPRDKPDLGVGPSSIT